MAKIELNLMDRAIAAISPGWAVQRMKARATIALAGGYFSGGKGRRPALSGWQPGAADADGDISPDLVDLRSYSRDLARTSALAGGAINTVVTNVVGTGLALQPAPDVDLLGLDEAAAKAWIDGATREWKLWAESADCDITRAQNFYGLQSLVFRSVLESGDVFVIPTMAGPQNPYRLALQVIEADRICNPNFSQDTDRLVQGVELDDNGAPITYHIASRHPGARRRAGMTWSRLPAFNASGRRNVLHIFERRRPGQTRGVPYLASVIEPLKQLTRYSEAEISAAVISAAFAVFVKMDPEAFSTLFDDSDGKDYIKSALKWDGSVPTASMDAPGKAVNLLPGESVESPDLGRPNANFDPFVQAVLRQVGVGLELPFEVLIKHFTASYSAARAALLDAWRFFRGRRDFLATTLCQPVEECWIEEAVSLGRVRAPGFFADPVWRRAWSNAVWTGDGPGSIDPLKEINAAVARIDAGISTVAAESILHDGVDWETKHKQRVREVTARRKDGVETAAKDPASQLAPDNPDGNDGDAPAPVPIRPRPAPGYHADTATASLQEAAADVLAMQTFARVGLVEDRLVAITAKLDQAVSREVPAPHVTINQGDIHVAPASVVNQVPEAPAPAVHAYFEATLPEAPAPVVNNQVDVHIPQAAAKEPTIQKMEIVGMPPMELKSMPVRETTTVIERDLENNITKTTQTERDA